MSISHRLVFRAVVYHFNDGTNRYHRRQINAGFRPKNHTLNVLIVETLNQNNASSEARTERAAPPAVASRLAIGAFEIRNIAFGCARTKFAASERSATTSAVSAGAGSSRSVFIILKPQNSYSFNSLVYILWRCMSLPRVCLCKMVCNLHTRFVFCYSESCRNKCVCCT